jgi:hypothetical protein
MEVADAIFRFRYSGSRVTVPRSHSLQVAFSLRVPNERFVLVGVEVNATFHRAEQGAGTLEPLYGA